MRHAIGLFAWGFLGTAETTVGTYATNAKGEVVCFLTAEKASKVHVGDSANVGGELVEVASIDTVPMSRAEARDILGSDYLASTLVGDDWTYLVHFTCNVTADFTEGVPLPASITTESVTPITLIFRGAS